MPRRSIPSQRRGPIKTTAHRRRRVLVLAILLGVLVASLSFVAYVLLSLRGTGTLHPVIVFRPPEVEPSRVSIEVALAGPPVPVSSVVVRLVRNLTEDRGTSPLSDPVAWMSFEDVDADLEISQGDRFRIYDTAEGEYLFLVLQEGRGIGEIGWRR